jgi:hypothetical protein
MIGSNISTISTTRLKSFWANTESPAMWPSTTAKRTYTRSSSDGIVPGRFAFASRDKDVVLDPVGTNLIGAKGRVDMIGDAGASQIRPGRQKAGRGPGVSVAIKTQDEQRQVEEEKEPDDVEWAWKIATPPPRIKYIEVNAESFFDALMEVINA